MSRPKGSKNKIQVLPDERFSFTFEQRIELFAELIVERIIEDRRNGRNLIDLLEIGNVATSIR